MILFFCFELLVNGVEARRSKGDASTSFVFPFKTKPSRFQHPQVYGPAKEKPLGEHKWSTVSSISTTTESPSFIQKILRRFG